ncbi:phosphoribosylamine--glycine ligase [Lacicoccus alkaliphilus]|uniref:Phosphoribosylamine--glycine ligase n=1 Tax=Lacicoccus alkaliphilus DSM 16010 TaxID=1123231 RepID=A0A1M7CQI6_9BACL|nr:phosphoribosylamine--glycine ligase [Salinicoccus alkaliphilus]SHL69089.1 phosphoribosylamine--glycine ligase [Salinicoccus alkaliphilus DSM 16010]
MKVAVIGSGGREHALVKKFYESPSVTEVVAIPGNYAMGGMAKVANDVDLDDFNAVAEVCDREAVEWAVIGPEAPLSEGLVDFLERQHDIKVFGPRKFEARLESSKAFSKAIMKKYDIPTAKYELFTDYDAAQEYLDQVGTPIVIKKDGLAAGKGVVVAMDEETAREALHDMMDGSEGQVVIEEYLEGEEFSLMVLVNEEFIYPFEVMAQDHKRAFDGDEGPNTGGMGAYAPVTHIPESARIEAVEKIVKPMTRAMMDEGLSYFGVMYLGAMVTEDGVKVIEFNARFGDPEAQVLLSLLKSDLGEVLEHMYTKKPFELEWKEGFVAGVMLASKGYPGDYEKGKAVNIPEVISTRSFVSGLSRTDAGTPVTSGGRVLLVCGHGATIEDALEEAYTGVAQVEYESEDLFHRSDIGQRAMK